MFVYNKSICLSISWSYIEPVKFAFCGRLSPADVTRNSETETSSLITWVGVTGWFRRKNRTYSQLQTCKDWGVSLEPGKAGLEAGGGRELPSWASWGGTQAYWCLDSTLRGSTGSLAPELCALNFTAVSCSNCKWLILWKMLAGAEMVTHGIFTALAGDTASSLVIWVRMWSKL